MGNLASFFMRVRGKSMDCQAFMDKIPSDLEIDEQQGTEDDSMYYISGYCKNSMSYSMIDAYYTAILPIAAERNVEFEAFCYDRGNPDWIEHYHYKGAERLVHDNLGFYVFCDEEPIEEYIDPEDMDKYYQERPNLYILKDEYKTAWELDENTGRFILHFTMSFDDLKG